METLDEATLRFGTELRRVPATPGTALFDKMRRDGYFPAGPEDTLIHDGVQYQVQPAALEQHPNRVYRVRFEDWGNVVSIEDSPPYYSQRHIGRKNACGLACVASFIEHRTGEKPSVAELSLQWDPKQIGTNADDLVKAGQQHGVVLRAVMDADTTVDQLPAIVLHLYGWDKDLVEYKTFDGWHWSILLGMDDQEVILHDPLYLGTGGQSKRYPRSQWDSRCYLPHGSGRWYVVYATGASPRDIVSREELEAAPRNDPNDAD